MTARSLQISASILSANWARFGDDAQSALTCGADRIHFDTMDNHFVPTLSFGPALCQALRDDGIHAPIDVHLMTSPVHTLIEPFTQAGASSITFHIEASDNPQNLIHLIHQQGCQAGLAINPDTGLETIKPFLSSIEQLLVMSVQPGKAGQSFIPKVLPKLHQAKELLRQHHTKVQLCVDGGINIHTIKDVTRAGVDIAVMGSALFKAGDYSTVLSELRKAANPD